MPLIVFVMGLMIGSFLNVCIYRLPREESVVFPPSRCPYCNMRLTVRDLVPVVSYVFLKGKCRSCQGVISKRYPLVELLSGLLSLFFYYFYQPDLLLFVTAALLGYLLLVITFTDLEHRIIPDEVSFVGALAGFIMSFFLATISPLQSLLGIVVGGGSLLIVAVVSRGGMGGGDVKMMAMVGSFLGWQGALGTIFVGAVLGSVGGLMGRKGMKDAIPFGPFLAAAALIVLLYGSEMWQWYLRLIGAS